MRTRLGRLPLPALLVALTLGSAGCSLPQLEDYPQRPLAQTSFVYAADGTLITTLHAVENRVVLHRDEMSAHLRDAAVAIEDRRFFSHHGVDLRAVLRAMTVNLASGHIVEGGSTITQQLVKLLYVGDAETFRRKFDEAVLAWQLEDRLTKQQILTRYLNAVYFGEGAYGAEAAAKTYFGVHADQLTLAESALLAGLITAPNHFDPFIRMASAVGRRNVVLRLMHRLGSISGSELRDALAEPVSLRTDIVQDRYPYPYFVDYFKRWFLANPAFGRTRDAREQLLFSGGLRIETTLDPSVQDAAQRAVSEVLAYPGDPDAAITVVDPQTGFVRAMVGGHDAAYWRDDDAGRVNLATGAGGTGRQTGSAFKPFALVAALEHGISPSTVFAAPSTIEIPEDDGKVWSVTNANGEGYGSMTLASATVNSVNTVYAQLIHELGAATVTETAQRMGMRCCTDVGGPTGDLLALDSAVLGSNEATTLEMASAFGTLAAGGQHAQPVPVTSVTDAQGNVLFQADPEPTQVVDPGIAAVADGILQDAVLYGTGTAANIGRPQIGKTGTEEDHTNAWFVGAIPQFSAAVWVGFHEGQVPMEPPRTRITVFGGTWPAQIWRVMMLAATQELPEEPFPTPDVSYVSVAVDVTQQPMCLPNAYTLPQNVQVLQFISGTEPRQVCTSPTSLEEVVVPSVVGFAQDEATATLESAGFYVEVEVADSTQPPGSVIYETPTGGTSAFQTSTVKITVAKDPASVEG